MAGNGFTPIPNCLLDKMAEMKPAEFKALMAIYRLVIGYKEYRDSRRRHISITKLQEFIGLSRQGVINAMAALEEYGYVTKVDTDGVNEWVVNSVDQQEPESSQDSLPVVNSVDGTSQDSLPPSNKRKVSKEKDTTAAAREAEKQNDDAFVFYENNIGGMTPRISEWIKDAIGEHGEWIVIDAMDEAVKSNVRRWKYVQAILENWKKNGRVRQNGHAAKSTNGRSSSANGENKKQIKDRIWKIVCKTGRSRYHEAMSLYTEQDKMILKGMGRWTDICNMDEKTFNIKFYETYNGVMANAH